MSATPDSFDTAGEEGSASRGSLRIPLRRSAVCLGISVGALPLIWALLQGAPSPAVGAVGFAAVALASAVGAWFAGVTLLRSLFARSPRSGLIGLGGAALLVVHGGMAFLGVVGALLSEGGGRGRQLRRFGRVLLPRLKPGRDWSRGVARIEIEIAAPSRAGLAACWRENARTEHASVGAFAVLTMDLLALGAPPELLAAAHRDGLDEIRHAELCFGLATAIDGADVSPAPFPASRRARLLPRTRILALARLAVDSLVDGVLHEGVSARTLARVARLAEVPQIREILAGLAADEGRHAAHAWHVVQWCVREGGDPVVHALRGAALVLPERPGHGVSGDARDGAWERWGIAGRALEEEEYAAARAGVMRRVEALPRGRWQGGARAA